MNYEELYETNADFRMYVDKSCRNRNCTVKEMLELAITKEYAKYVVQNEKGVHND
mgnify:CR=1 FL=1|jgi:hypothetical protein